MFRIIPLTTLGFIGIYLYMLLLRFNSWQGLNFSKITILIILFLILAPAINFSGVWFLTLLHIFQVGIVIEIINLFLEKLHIKQWNILYNSCSLPIIITVFIFIYGYYNINNIKRTEYTIYTEKNISKIGYKIGLISDVHYGNAIDKKTLQEQIKRLNQENFNILVLAGDIVDESTSLEEVKDIFKILGETNTKNGIYYVYGNHDTSKYRKKPNYTLKDLKSSVDSGNIILLRDNSVKVNKDLIITGRKDKSEKSRKNSSELIEKLDRENYLILIDHQPVELEKNSKLGYDLELSGHTHNGQIFPSNLIIRFFNLAELIYGKKVLGEFNSIVSSGFSGWGYPLRTAGHSEYVVINIFPKQL